MSVCSVVLSKRIHVAVCGPIRTTFGTHMQIHIERVMCGKKNSPCNLGGTWGVLRHKKLINVGKLPNRWTDRHQIFHTYADSFRNEHRLNIFTHLTPKGGILGGFRGSTIQKSGNAAERLDRLPPNFAHVCRFTWE